MLAMMSPPRGMGRHGYEVSTKRSVGFGTLASAWALPSATVAGNAKKKSSVQLVQRCRVPVPSSLCARGATGRSLGAALPPAGPLILPGAFGAQQLVARPKLEPRASALSRKLVPIGRGGGFGGGETRREVPGTLGEGLWAVPGFPAFQAVQCSAATANKPPQARSYWAST